MSKLVVDATGNDLTYRIIGAAMAVHNFIGPGYKEEVYERALAVELRDRGINVEQQFSVEVYYEDEQVGQFYLDLFVERVVVVEVKAFPHLLTKDEEGQVINYLKATQTSVGLLINFGRPSLDWQRIFPPKTSVPSNASGGMMYARRIVGKASRLNTSLSQNGTTNCGTNERIRLGVLGSRARFSRRRQRIVERMNELALAFRGYLYNSARNCG